ncbi:MAG TPA: hypothetical protein PK640_08930 [Verrucomicrobiota bacterium]|nr:hypothetical protein [Verrucomicrobiota bacterium]
MRTRFPLFALASFILQATQAQVSPPATALDLMVVYTPQALNDAGGATRLHAQIDEILTEANRCFSNSQVNARFQLVHRGVVPYTESGNWDTDRTRLRTAGDATWMMSSVFATSTKRTWSCCLAGGPSLAVFSITEGRITASAS